MNIYKQSHSLFEDKRDLSVLIFNIKMIEKIIIFNKKNKNLFIIDLLALCITMEKRIILIIRFTHHLMIISNWIKFLKDHLEVKINSK